MQYIPIAKDEFIGKKISILTCTDPTWDETFGVIVDESKNTFIIEVAVESKQISKHIATFSIKKDEKDMKVKGKHIAFRPEDRIKKAR